MSNQVLPTSVAQRIIINSLTREEMKPSEIVIPLQGQFGAETLSRIA